RVVFSVFSNACPQHDAPVADDLQVADMSEETHVILGAATHDIESADLELRLIVGCACAWKRYAPAKPCFHTLPRSKHARRGGVVGAFHGDGVVKHLGLRYSGHFASPLSVSLSFSLAVASR